MTRVPLRAMRRIFCTTSLCACGQYQPPLQLPAVDDVADQIERVGAVHPEEFEEIDGLAAARPQVDIRQPDGPVVEVLVYLRQHARSKPRRY